MVWKLAVIAFFVVLLAALVFNFGPDFLEWFADKVDEWEEILDDMENDR